MEDTTPFPLFAPMNKTSGEGAEYDYLMCMFATGDMEKDGQFCAHHCETFESFVTHLKSQHGLKLKAGRDYCTDCQVIFRDRLDLTHHYLIKILNSEEFDLVCESPRTNLDLSLWLAPLFNNLRNSLKEVTTKLMFNEDFPPLESVNSHVIL